MTEDVLVERRAPQRQDPLVRFRETIGIGALLLTCVLLFVSIYFMSSLLTLAHQNHDNILRITPVLEKVNKDVKTFTDDNQKYLDNHHLTQTKIDQNQKTLDQINTVLCSFYVAASKPQPLFCAGR